MLSRAAAVTGLLLLTANAAQAQEHEYGPDFGLSSPIVATQSTVNATFLGWEASTVWANEVFAMTTDQYAHDIALGCFGFYADTRTDCIANSMDLGGLEGTDLFGKSAIGQACEATDYLNIPCLSTPVTYSLTWVPQTEIIFALRANQGDGDYNWFFSGDPTRNFAADGFNIGSSGPYGYAHLGVFGPSGVPGDGPDDEDYIIPGTVGFTSFGFEDDSFEYSDWDFNNAIFTLDAVTFSLPQDAVPEPGTMGMVAAGVATIGFVGRRRRFRGPPSRT